MEYRLNIALIEPEIPQNTGNIARTCAATGARLHLVGPMGFTITDKQVKRAGLDYWHLMELHVHPDFDTMMAEYPHAVYHFATTKAPRGYHEVSFGPEDFLVFGCETKGLPESLLSRVYDRCIRIPMRSEARSLNLSNSVAILTYEALRQTGFPGLCGTGEMAEEHNNTTL